MEVVLRSLEEHPVRLSPAVLRMRVSIAGGDGAVCAGGSQAEHGIAAAAEKLWSFMVADAPHAPCTEGGRVSAMSVVMFSLAVDDV